MNIEVGKKYRSKNGEVWECIFVDGPLAWCRGAEYAASTAYVFKLTGETVSLFVSAESYDLVEEVTP